MLTALVQKRGDKKQSNLLPLQQDDHVCMTGTPNTAVTLVLLNPDIPAFTDSVDPDQLASEEAK